MLFLFIMTQHELHLMQLRFQYQENSQRYLLRSYTTKTDPMNSLFYVTATRLELTTP